MLTRTLLTLAEVSFHFGMIGIDEYFERCDVAYWLADDQLPDPRSALGSEEEPESEERPPSQSAGEPDSRPKKASDDSGVLEFLFQGWVFTKSDPDSYPSTPHGHLGDPNIKWPKLNPYTGRVFKAKHQEDVSKRLRKKDLRLLWNDEKFRDFCRSYILWYADQFRSHSFSVAHPLRFPRFR